MLSAFIVGCALSVATAEGPTPDDLAAYREAKAAAGRDADAQVALALWCEAHGMAAEKSRHLARAVLLDPSNAKARGLLGFVNHEGKWMRPEDVTRAVEESPERQALFKEYKGRRAQAADKADDQYRLARWCDERGLAQQATAHYHRVIELDPGRELAWKHLGFKKVDGRWVKPEIAAARKADREAQAKADKLWKPKLDHVRRLLSGRNPKARAEAMKKLAAIEDPRAVPMVLAVLARGDERLQLAAVEVLGRLEGPDASGALASMAVFSQVATVRTEAGRQLTQRDPREFARLLADLLRDEIKYKKNNVSGPGSQGELFVEGKDANVKRLYTPLQHPELAPGDRVGLDPSGRMVADRTVGRYVGPILNAGGIWNLALTQAGMTSGQAGFIASGLSPSRPDVAAGVLQKAGVSPELSRKVANRMTTSPLPIIPMAPFGLTTRPIYEDSLRIPVGLMEEEARVSASVAQQQLNQDVQQIESHNAAVRELNQRVATILKNVSGRDLGDDREKWMEWVYHVEGYGVPLKVASTPPTIVEAVPLNYQPQAVASVNPPAIAGYRIGPSCFAGGTPVRTLRGARPIEEVQPGDQVLTQDTTSGRLGYQPVVAVFHNPPNVTYRIDLGSESVYPTGIHRFWKAGRGWIMARDVKAGDRLRTIGGAVEVVAVTKDEVQPVFNLQLDGGDDFCVGELGVIAHDNSLINPVEHPFDGVPKLAELGASRTP
jgi:hypothetical protein